MPTVKRYQDGTGFYIRSNIDGKFVTLQLSPRVDGLLSDLDYQDDDQISWDFLQPLCDCGHVYTNKSGTEVSTEEIEPDSSLTSDALSSEEKRRLNAFLEDLSANQIRTDSEQESGNDSGGTDFKHISEEKKGFVEKWSPSEEEYEANLNRIARAKDSMGVLKSVAHHATEHPIQPDRFRVSSQGVPTYSFDTNGVQWTVHDFRRIGKINTDVELFFTIQPGTSENQSLTIEPTTVEWHTHGDRFSENQVDHFISVFPDILYYLNNLVDGPEVNPGSFISSPTADLTPGDRERIEAVRSLSSIDVGERVIGVVLSVGDDGYGRIRGHTGHTYPFSQEDSESINLKKRNLISFDTEYVEDTIHAKNIRVEQSKAPISKFVECWPDSYDETISWVRNHWIQNNQNDKDEQTVTLVQEPSGESCEITVQIDSLAYRIARANEDISIDQAVRTLLKETIDGARFKLRRPRETTQVDVILPSDILSMVDLMVEISSSFHNRSQLISAALQHSIDLTETVEVGFDIPRSYLQSMERIAEEREISIDEFGREALEKALIEATADEKC
jgi:hypothetical protein